ncbi:hypothetical protein [Falsirhodobacter halotolerans]|uniref:hypothetical protein n=1 Tax=Falsirhodobacter halotolerans TaxID=1146892 RepID=UPI001FD20D21|nr:hypothetical protein [Falsirhodobacter halotolerans]MCJ8140571.1 hypothetical protein [Falsirhodobacter halotolerans]
MVEAILNRIEAAIATSTYDVMTDLAAELEAAMPGADADAALRQRAAVVARRLGAVAEGMRAAQWRLEDIRAMGRDGDRLVTYDMRGQRQDAAFGGQIGRRV